MRHALDRFDIGTAVVVSSLPAGPTRSSRTKAAPTPGRPRSVVVIAIGLMIAVLFPVSATRTLGSSNLLGASISLSSGHDSEVWADDGFGALRPSAAEFVTLEAEGGVKWPGRARSRVRGSVLGSAFVSTYTGEGPPLDFGASGAGSIGRTLSSRQTLQLRSSAGLFRREEAAIFDSDEGAVALSWIYRTSSVGFAATAEHQWISYGARSLELGSDDHQSDRHLDILGSAVLPLSPRSWLELTLGLHRVESNDPTVRNDGPRLLVAGQHRLWDRTDLRVYGAWGRRAYDDYAVFDLTVDPAIDTGEERRDSYLRFGLALSHAASTRFGVELETAAVHQASNVSALEFDQIRVRVGLVANFGRKSEALDPSAQIRSREILRRVLENAFDAEDGASTTRHDRSATGNPSRPHGWRPVIVTGGVRFLHPAQGASTVHVVGTFNQWDPEATALSDDDGDGRWECVVPLAEGVYSYAFVVDGVWTTPLDAPRYDSDGFGGRNGVLDLRGSR